MPELADWRQQLDEIDGKLIELLAQRYQITEQIGRFKAGKGLPVRDKAREEEQLARAERLANELGLDTELARNSLKIIIEAAVVQQKQIQKT